MQSVCEVNDGTVSGMQVIVIGERELVMKDGFYRITLELIH
jgi:hypothetical protein